MPVYTHIRTVVNYNDGDSFTIQASNFTTQTCFVEYYNGIGWIEYENSTRTEDFIILLKPHTNTFRINYSGETTDELNLLIEKYPSGSELPNINDIIETPILPEETEDIDADYKFSKTMVNYNPLDTFTIKVTNFTDQTAKLQYYNNGWFDFDNSTYTENFMVTLQTEHEKFRLLIYGDSNEPIYSVVEKYEVGDIIPNIPEIIEDIPVEEIPEDEISNPEFLLDYLATDEELAIGLQTKVDKSSYDSFLTTNTSALDLKADALDLSNHTSDTTNPHNVTKDQVGLGNVDNTADVDKPVSTAQQAIHTALQGNIDSHVGDTTNPHNVTKEQIGLGAGDSVEFAELTVGSQVLGGDGSIGTPSFSFASEPSTGFYRSGAFQFAFVAAGAQRFKINGGTAVDVIGNDFRMQTPSTSTVSRITRKGDNSGIIFDDGLGGGTKTVSFSGNVGIGTDDPSAKLHVVGGVNSSTQAARFDANQSTTIFSSTYAGCYITNTDQTNGNYARINFGDGDAPATAALASRITDHSANTGNLEFWTRGDTYIGQRMVITPDGNVGIGTDNPSAKLDVDGGSVGTPASFSSLVSGGSMVLSLRNQGDSNINTDVVISAGQASNRSGGRIIFGRENSGSWASNVNNVDGFISLNPVSNGLVSEAVRVTSSGNVGIGTPDPQAKLDVAGDANIDTDLTVGGGVSAGNSLDSPDALMRREDMDSRYGKNPFNLSMIELFDDMFCSSTNVGSLNWQKAGGIRAGSHIGMSGSCGVASVDSGTTMTNYSGIYTFYNSQSGKGQMRPRVIGAKYMFRILLRDPSYSTVRVGFNFRTSTVSDFAGDVLRGWGLYAAPVSDTWTGSTTYAVGDFIKPTTPNGLRYRCTVAGDSDTSEPTWVTASSGDTVVDGGVTWELDSLEGTGNFQFTSGKDSITGGTDVLSQVVRDSGVPIDTGWHNFYIEITDAHTAEMWMDDGVKSTLNLDTLQAAEAIPCFFVRTEQNAQATLEVDAFAASIPQDRF